MSYKGIVVLGFQPHSSSVELINHPCDFCFLFILLVIFCFYLFLNYYNLVYSSTNHLNHPKNFANEKDDLIFYLLLESVHWSLRRLNFYSGVS